MPKPQTMNICQHHHPRVRALLQLAAAGACLLLASCGGGGGGTSSAGSSTNTSTTPSGGNPPIVSMSFAPPSVAAGQVTTLSWTASDATSCTASGAWSGSQSTSGSVVVTQIAGSYTYSLSCSGAGGSASGSATLNVTELSGNTTPVVVDSGPAGVGRLINVPFVSVTLCAPGTSNCQTIDHVLLDTGSYGLRILSPGVLDASLALPAVTGPGGNPVGECAPFVSFSVWGPVRRAKVQIAGETAASVPVQVIADAAFTGAPPGCSGTVGTVTALGAKGILGVGVLNHDCGAGCTTQPANGYYFECTTSNCTGSTMALADQVSNPVAAFAKDNNGAALVMPAVAPGGTATLTGSLIFGIDTQPNNNVGSAKVYATDYKGNFITTYKGTSLTSSFLDSGSNGFFFSDRTIPSCSTAGGFSGFYCPATTLSLSAVNSSADGSVSGTVAFSVENPQTLGATIKAASIGGDLGNPFRSFDWGLPFFFGRTVFIAIDGASTAHGTGPYWAY